MRRWLGVLWLLATLLMVGDLSAEPDAAGREAARNYFRLGDESFKQGDYEVALESFVAADAIMNVPTTGLEVGRTLVELGRLIEARDRLRAVRDSRPEGFEPQAQIEARAEARGLYESIGAEIPTVEVIVTTSDGEPAASLVIAIDGTPLQQEATGLPRRVDPGRHAIAVSAAGYERAEHEVVVERRQASKLEVVLMALEAPPKAPPAEPMAAAPRTARPAFVRPASFAAIGFGSASMIAGLVTGIIALGDASELKDNCPEKRCAPADQDRLSRTTTLAHISTATLVGGGVVLAAGVLGVVLLDDERHALEAALGLGSIAIRGKF
jgi:hypothetical protein